MLLKASGMLANLHTCKAVVKCEHDGHSGPRLVSAELRKHTVQGARHLGSRSPAGPQTPRCSAALPRRRQRRVHPKDRSSQVDAAQLFEFQATTSRPEFATHHLSTRRSKDKSWFSLKSALVYRRADRDDFPDHKTSAQIANGGGEP